MNFTIITSYDEWEEELKNYTYSEWVSYITSLSINGDVWITYEKTAVLLNIVYKIANIAYRFYQIEIPKKFHKSELMLAIKLL